MHKLKVIPVLLSAWMILVYIPFSLSHTQAGESAVCVVCHENTTPGVVGQWRNSKHSENEVGCLDCHGASASEPDALEHWAKTIAMAMNGTETA